MVKVRHKETGKVRVVYGISGLFFLMWEDSTDSWFYADMNKYRPLEADDG